MTLLRRRPRFTPLHLAGWLFADMLLVLALVSMGDRGDPLAAAHPSPSPSASSSAPAGPRSVERKPVRLSVSAEVGDTARMVRLLRSATARYEGRTAAFVLTFGETTEPADGQAYARKVNRSLRTARPDMFADATTRDFWNGGPPGTADLEIYFYTR